MVGRAFSAGLALSQHPRVNSTAHNAWISPRARSRAASKGICDTRVVVDRERHGHRIITCATELLTCHLIIAFPLCSVLALRAVSAAPTIRRLPTFAGTLPVAWFAGPGESQHLRGDGFFTIAACTRCVWVIWLRCDTWRQRCRYGWWACCTASRNEAGSAPAAAVLLESGDRATPAPSIVAWSYSVCVRGNTCHDVARHTA